MAYRIANSDALLQQTWEDILWEESQEQDIFTGLSGTFSDDNGNLPDSIVQNVNLQPGSNQHTIGMILDLTGSGRQGAGINLVGYTETMVTRRFTVYANDVRHGVDTEQYGLYAHRNEAYGILKKVNPLLGKWLKARRGKHIRQALLETVSDNLTASPTSLTNKWNRHIFVKNAAITSQPTYDNTLANYTANIVAALSSAGTSTSANVDTNFFTTLEYYVTNVWKMMPLDDGSYIVTVPSRQAVFLKQLQSSTSFAGLQRLSLVQKYVEAAYGQYLMQFGRFHMVVDDRAPVINYNTSTSVLTTAYRDVGSTDSRSSYTNTGSNRVFDVGYVLGKAAVTCTTAMKPRYDDDITDFNRLRSIGVSTTYGYQVTEFEAETATTTSRIGQNCAVWLAYSGNLTA
jgi:hypothetical protein